MPFSRGATWGLRSEEPCRPSRAVVSVPKPHGWGPGSPQLRRHPPKKPQQPAFLSPPSPATKHKGLALKRDGAQAFPDKASALPTGNKGPVRAQDPINSLEPCGPHFWPFSNTSPPDLMQRSLRGQVPLILESFLGTVTGYRQLTLCRTGGPVVTQPPKSSPLFDSYPLASSPQGAQGEDRLRE